MPVKTRIIRAAVYWELALSVLMLLMGKIELAGIAILYAILFVLMTSY